MVGREKVIGGLWCCNHAGNCAACPFDIKGGIKGSTCLQYLMEAAYDALKAHEPRLVTEADFENADAYGFLPVWVEDKDDSELICDCITKTAITNPDEDYHYRYWTSRPDKATREAIPWN